MNEIIGLIKLVNQQLDNLKRASHIHGSFGRHEDIFPPSEIWAQIRNSLSELNGILDQSIGNRRNLNTGERKRFEYIVAKTQGYSKKILEGILPEIS